MAKWIERYGYDCLWIPNTRRERKRLRLDITSLKRHEAYAWDAKYWQARLDAVDKRKRRPR